MPKDWTKQLIDDVSELDNNCFNDMPLTIVIRTGQEDNGDRYFDATVYTGHEENKGDTLADVVGADSLSELFNDLVKNWRGR